MTPNHKTLVEKAKAAIEEVFRDKEVTQEETYDSLDELREILRNFINELDLEDHGDFEDSF